MIPLLLIPNILALVITLAMIYSDNMEGGFISTPWVVGNCVSAVVICIYAYQRKTGVHNILTQWNK